MEIDVETVLKLKMEMLDDYTAALGILADAWEVEGRPTDPKKLIPVLKRTLDTCKLKSITYPRIFLRRKGELTRGEFQPGTLFIPGAPISFTTETHPKVPQDWMRQAVEEDKRQFEERWERSRSRAQSKKTGGT